MSLFLRVRSQDNVKEVCGSRLGDLEWTHCFQKSHFFIQYHRTENRFPIFICVDHN